MPHLLHILSLWYVQRTTTTLFKFLESSKNLSMYICLLQIRAAKSGTAWQSRVAVGNPSIHRLWSDLGIDFAEAKNNINKIKQVTSANYTHYIDHVWSILSLRRSRGICLDSAPVENHLVAYLLAPSCAPWLGGHRCYTLSIHQHHVSKMSWTCLDRLSSFVFDRKPFQLLSLHCFFHACLRLFELAIFWLSCSNDKHEV